MEHPLIGKLDELTEEQLLERISDLNQKLNIAMRTGNGHLCNQIRMAIDSFRSHYQQRLSKPTTGSNFDGKIDIQWTLDFNTS